MFFFPRRSRTLLRAAPPRTALVDLACCHKYHLSTPEQKYISDASRKAPENWVFCSGIRLGSDYHRRIRASTVRRLL